MQAILILLLFQLAGEVAVRMLHLPLSGGIMGMVLLFVFLLIYSLNIIGEHLRDSLDTQLDEVRKW